MKEEKKDNIYENIRLNKAFKNYKKIVDKNLPYKFSYLDEWMLKSSNLLLNECKSTIPKYRKYKRGTIIKADFGVNIGSEMSQVHFAIVLNKNDNPKSNVLTVLPLTSKKEKYNLCLGTFIAEKLIKKISNEVDKQEKIFKKIKKEAEKDNSDTKN